MPHDGHHGHHHHHDHHDHGHHHHDDEPAAHATLYEKRVDALYQLLQQQGRGAAQDAIRAGQECLKDVDWDRTNWHDRWIEEMRDRLLAVGVLDDAELSARLERIRREELA